MKSRPETVTDHALVRYLERVYGVDVQSLRRRIAGATHAARAAGASSVKVDGVRYIISKEGRVLTVHGSYATMSKRAARWKAKRS